MGVGVTNKVQGTIHPRQVQALIDAYTKLVGIGFVIGTSSTTLPNNSFRIGYLQNAGRNGQDLPNQRATTFDEAGVLCTNEGNFGTGVVRLSTGPRVEQANPDTGAQIYADIFQETNGDFTITLKQRDPVSGAESNFVATATAYNICFLYRYNLHQLPPGALVSKDVLTLPRPSASSILDKAEVLTVTAVNTLSALSEPARLTNGVFWLKINNLMFDNLPGGGITVSGTTVTWNSAITGLVLNPGDRVIAYYKAARRY